MNKFFWLSILSILFIVCGCKDDDETIDGSASLVVIGIQFVVVDENGNDLIDTNYPNSINSSEIEIFYGRDGKMCPSEEIMRAESGKPDIPENTFEAFSIDKQHKDIGNFMSLRLDSPHLKDGEEKPSITYIKWKEGDIDTISCTMVNDAWYYGVKNEEEILFNNKKLSRTTNENWLYSLVK